MNRRRKRFQHSQLSTKKEKEKQTNKQTKKESKQAGKASATGGKAFFNISFENVRSSMYRLRRSPETEWQSFHTVEQCICA